MTYASILKMSKKAMPLMRLSHQKTLSECVYGCILEGGQKLTDIARGMFRKTSLRHNYKKLDRFLSNSRIHIEEHGEGLFKFMVNRECGKLFDVVVFMDWTMEHGKHVLMFSMKVGKRSMPFYWYCIDKDKINRSQNMIEQNALRLVKSWMHKGQRLIIIADRGFHRSVLQKNLQKAGVDYIIRIPKTTHIKTKLHEGALSNLDVRFKRLRDFKACFLGKDAKVPVRMIIKKIKVKQSKYKKHQAKTSTWYLSTTLDNYSKEDIVELYSRRMGIECSFKDLKTTLGWRFEKRISRPDRLARYLLILVMTLLMAWLTSLRKIAPQILAKVSLIKGFKQNTYISFVQSGLWIMRYLMPKYHILHHRKPLWCMT